MGAKKTPGRDIFNQQLITLGPLPQFYTTLVRMERPDFTAERIRRARGGKCVDFDVLEVLQRVSGKYVRALNVEA